MELLKDKNDLLMVPPLAQLVLEMASEIVFLAQLVLLLKCRIKLPIIPSVATGSSIIGHGSTSSQMLTFN